MRLADAEQAGETGLRLLFLQQPRAKFAQDREVETRVCQGQAKRIFPVDTTAHRIGRLTIGKTFHELHDGDEEQAAGRDRRLSTRGKESSELLIDGKHAEFIAQQHQWIAVGKGCPRDAGRFLRDGIGCLRMERHRGTPFLALVAPTAGEKGVYRFPPYSHAARVFLTRDLLCHMPLAIRQHYHDVLTPMWRTPRTIDCVDSDTGRVAGWPAGAITRSSHGLFLFRLRKHR